MLYWRGNFWDWFLFYTISLSFIGSVSVLLSAGLFDPMIIQ